MHLKREIFIERDLETVYHYILDFSHLFEWDPQVTEGERLTLGPTEKGARFLFSYSIFGLTQKLEYELTEKIPGELLRYETKTKSFSTEDVIRFKKEGDGVRVFYEVSIHLKNYFSELVLAPFMSQVANTVMKNLRNCLEREAKGVNYKEKYLSIFAVPYRFTKLGWNRARKRFPATLGKEKTVLITGPTSGLGYAASKRLAARDCELILVARNEKKLEGLTSELREKGFQKNIETYICSMENLEQVHKVCEAISQKGYALDALINNAGALYNEEKKINGIERTTLVDLVAPYIFSKKLAPLLEAKRGSIINVSSGGMYGAELNLKALRSSPKPYGGARAYAYAKRGLMVMTEFLNEELKEKQVKVHAMHPGWADTPGVLKSLPLFHKITRYFLRSPFEGADTIVWLALTNPKQGGYFWLDRRVQNTHILKSTKENSDTQKELKTFLESFERS